MQRIKSRYSAASKKNQIQLCFEIKGEQTSLPIKCRHFEYVLSELLDNAIKFSNPHSTVIAEIIFIGNSMVIKVADTGVGIPQKFISKIFRKYFQYKPCSGKRHGAGLGLAIVHGIVKHYQGRISIQSEKGTGTVVEIFFNGKEPPEHPSI
ncbi:ATP-binding protein [candidate division KSB1 bacterium]|nr:ATP-binding protein [candidate division KSB1 bacterium]